MNRRNFLALPGLVATPPAGRAQREAERTPADWLELAEAMAVMELDAIQQVHPTWWQHMYYRHALPFSDNAMLFYGVGQPPRAEADRQRVRAWLTAGGANVLLGEASTECGRVWSIIVQGLLPGHLTRLTEPVLVELMAMPWERRRMVASV